MRKDVTFEGVLLILSILPSLADIGPSYGSNGQAKVGEDAIPIIEIRAEGKPMTSAQIRALEEDAAGKPLDIKVTYERRRKDCARRSKRKDFATFHYEGHLEGGLLFDSSHGHWITFEVNVLNVEPWTSELQFKEMDNNVDGYSTLEDIEATLAKEKNEYGKA
ncbi:Peptidyl-prolyl cis-trans isomerase [Trichuris trichiura]|uniref:Peptidyl-prolyl cis-trans isomerase n=1 Tax=Trichuris trichiura TaxID=36087 RepID=A0A077Z4M3_TRITR|nr:Peptidyl-prolyl cis-trans isomerase [Trichuris trichiura]